MRASCLSSLWTLYQVQGVNGSIRSGSNHLERVELKACRCSLKFRKQTHSHAQIHARNVLCKQIRARTTPRNAFWMNLWSENLFVNKCRAASMQEQRASCLRKCKGTSFTTFSLITCEHPTYGCLSNNNISYVEKWWHRAIPIANSASCLFD